VPSSQLVFPHEPLFPDEKRFPASDVKFYIADYTSPGHQHPSENIRLQRQPGRRECIYQFGYLNVNPGAVDLARAIEDHSPNFYVVFSKRGGCWTADKELLERSRPSPKWNTTATSTSTGFL
jgi:hypothetical protein